MRSILMIWTPAASCGEPDSSTTEITNNETKPQSWPPEELKRLHFAKLNALMDFDP